MFLLVITPLYFQSHILETNEEKKSAGAPKSRKMKKKAEAKKVKEL